MKNTDFKSIITAMINKTEPINVPSDGTKINMKTTISYEEGVKYFGSMMERILNSIEKIERNFEKMKEQN
jgi:hypothetical protein